MNPAASHKQPLKLLLKLSDCAIFRYNIYGGKLLFSSNQFSKKQKELGKHACLHSICQQVECGNCNFLLLRKHNMKAFPPNTWFLHLSLKSLRFLFLYSMIPFLLCSILFCSFHYAIPFHLLKNQGTELHPDLEIILRNNRETLGHLHLLSTEASC